jgi:hypothetical protein
MWVWINTSLECQNNSFLVPNNYQVYIVPPPIIFLLKFHFKSTYIWSYVPTLILKNKNFYYTHLNNSFIIQNKYQVYIFFLIQLNISHFNPYTPVDHIYSIYSFILTNTSKSHLHIQTLSTIFELKWCINKKKLQHFHNLKNLKFLYF